MATDVDKVPAEHDQGKLDQVDDQAVHIDLRLLFRGDLDIVKIILEIDCKGNTT